MRVRLSKTRWLVIIVVTLSAAGLLGWYIYERHDHDQHADHDHAKHTDKPKEPEAPVAGPGEADPGGGAAG